MDSETGQILLAEDLLRRALMANRAGERFIQERRPDGSSTTVSLYEQQGLYRCFAGRP